MKKSIINIGLTGHRPQRLGFNLDESHGDWDGIKKWLNSIYDEFYLYDEIHIWCGMADGCDIKFGLSLYTHDNVYLHCVLPCKNYNSENQYYSTLKFHSVEWIELFDIFESGCDDARDRYIVDHSDLLLAIWDGNKGGGVWSTSEYAKKTGKEIRYCPKEYITNNKESEE